MSDKKQKRVERRAQREALWKWRQHEPLTAEDYSLLDQMNRGRREVADVGGGFFKIGAQPVTVERRR